MKAHRQRQLSGLKPLDRGTSVPPPSARAEQGPADSDQGTDPERDPDPASRRPPQRAPHPPEAGAAAGSAALGKHRRAVTVPTQLVEQLRQRAQELDRFQTDLILDCLAATAAALEREHEAKRAPAGTLFIRPRRRAHRGRTVTTLTLYLTRDEVEAMDTLARRLGLTRSAVIAVALDRALGQVHQ